MLHIIKGIHPGVILGRELKKRGLRKGKFAHSVGEYPQFLGDIINQKRKMNPSLSLKIEQKLGFEEGILMALQAYYEVEKEKNKLPKPTPNLKKIRAGLFWDTDISTIKWDKYKKAVIQRIFERGNDAEKSEIIRFYGESVVNQYLK